MKKLLIGFTIIATMFLTGCTEETSFGKCVGIADDKNPTLVYKLDIWNTFLGILFLKQLLCLLLS